MEHQEALCAWCRCWSAGTGCPEVVESSLWREKDEAALLEQGLGPEVPPSLNHVEILQNTKLCRG